MTTASAFCGHCLLPVGCRPSTRQVNGAEIVFCCYGCAIAYQVRQGNGTEWESTWLLIRLGIGAFLAMNVMVLSLLIYSGTFDQSDAELLPIIRVLLWILATPALLILGWPFLRDVGRDAIKGRLTSAALIVIGAGGAYAYSVLAVITDGDHVYFDTATMLLVLFTLGRYLEALGRSRAARNLTPLLEADEQWVAVLKNGTELRRRVREVEAGMIMRVRPGERIPVDGTVVDGQSSVDEAVITGESRLVAKVAHSKVLGGSLNQEGSLLIRSDKAGTASAWASICRSVREALGRDNPTQRLVDRATSIFVPAVLIIAVLTLLYAADRQPLEEALLSSLAVLVVACPCALALAAPLATSLGIARLARRGCIIRGAGPLESMARIKTVAFDKTGTLTLGTTCLVRIETDGTIASEILQRAAGLEQHSEHALSRGILAAAAERGITPVPMSKVCAVPGCGIFGIAQEPVAVGSRSWMAEIGWHLPSDLARHAQALEASGYTVALVGWAGKVHGVLALDDVLVPETPAIVAALRHLKLRTVLLTGDLPEAARRVAEAAGVDAWRAELSPDGKQAALAELRLSGGPVAMVGDGLNDGPVLAGADVGIAVSSATDLAREAAVLVLPEGGLSLLPWTIGLARAVRGTIRINLFWAAAYNMAGITLAAFGLFQPLAAAVLMAGSSLLVVMNSLRLERFPDPQAKTPSRADRPFVGEKWPQIAPKADVFASVAKN